VELHLLKHSSLSETGVGFPESGSDTVEKVYYDENSERVWINKEQYFDGISKDVWEYRIGALSGDGEVFEGQEEAETNAGGD